jgi:type IV pilus assembly protein PilY1
MELDALTGKALDESPFDLNADSKFSTDDRVNDGTTENVYASGRHSTVGINPEPGILSDPSRALEYKYTPGTSGEISVITNNPGAGSFGRQSWRQLQ